MFLGVPQGHAMTVVRQTQQLIHPPWRDIPLIFELDTQPPQQLGEVLVGDVSLRILAQGVAIGTASSKSIVVPRHVYEEQRWKA